MDADIQKEYARQREHLERSVASLHKKLAKDTQIHRADNVRIMQVGAFSFCFQFTRLDSIRSSQKQDYALSA